MEMSNTLQVIDAVELTQGSHEQFSLEGDRILGQRTDVTGSDLMEDSLFATAPATAQGKGKKPKAKPMILEGTEGNDVLKGGKASDKIYGKGGDDILIGGKGNDLVVGGGNSGTFDQMTGGKGADTFSLVDSSNNAGYLNDSPEGVADTRGFALIHDFKLGEDKILLQGFGSHYLLVPAERFGSTSSGDTAIIYRGPEQDKSELVGIIKDVSLNNAYLETPIAFTYVN